MSKFNQEATYWARSTVNEYNEYTYVTPESICVRWEDKIQTFIDDMGRELLSNANVYSQKALERGGYLFLGKSTNTDPKMVDGAFEIKKTERSSSLNGVKFINKNILSSEKVRIG